MKIKKKKKAIHIFYYVKQTSMNYSTNINKTLDVVNLPFLKNGFNSLKSTSYSGPDLNKNFVCNNGIIIPWGNIVNYYKNHMFTSNVTNHPEYVVYDTKQIKIRYIVQVERNCVEDL